MAPSKRRRCTPITTAILLAVGMAIAAWLAYRTLHTPGTSRRVFRRDARPLKSDDTVDDQIFLGDTPPPTDLVVIQPSHRLLQAPPVTWQSTLAPLDLTVMIPMIAVTEPNAQRVLLIAQSLLPLASSMSLEVILLTDLTPATAASSDPHRYLDLFLANTSFKQLVTVHRVAPASPWFAPTVGAMLQHGLNVSRGRRVLVMTPYVKPREDFFLRLLDSKADVVSCSLLAHDDVIMHRGYVVSALGAHEGRLELERVDYAMKLTQKPNPPPPRAHQRLFPSLHCALFDRQRLQRAGGFTTHASTLIDSLRQGLIHNTSAARQHWKHEIEVQVGQFQFSASSIEVHQLKSLSNDARKVFYQLDKYSVMASALSKRLLGVAIEQNLLQLLQEQRIITSMPLSISDMMIEVAFRVTAVMKLVEQLTLPSTSPLDWLAWDVTARMGVDTRVDIRRDGIAELHAPQSSKPADDSSSDVWDDVLSQRLERSLIFECPLPTALRDNILQQVVGGKKPLEAQDQHHK